MQQRKVGAGSLAQLGGASRKLPGPGKTGAHRGLSSVLPAVGFGVPLCRVFQESRGTWWGPASVVWGQSPRLEPERTLAPPAAPAPLGGRWHFSFIHLAIYCRDAGVAVLGQGSGGTRAGRGLRGSTRETSDSKCPSASDAATVSGSERQGDVRLALEGGAAVGETFAAVQVRGDVLDAHGLRAGSG